MIEIKLPAWPFSISKKINVLEVIPSKLIPHETIIRKRKLKFFRSQDYSITKDCETNEIIAKPLYDD